MKKRENYFKVISLFQITLMISFVFAFSFILNSNFVGANQHGFCYDKDGNKVGAKPLGGCGFPLYDAPPITVEEASTPTSLSNTPKPTDGTGSAGAGGGGGTAAIASNAFTNGIDKLYGTVDGSSGAIGAVGLTNFKVQVTTDIQAAFEKSGMSDIQLNADGTLKSFFKGNQLHTVDPSTGIVTSSEVTTFELFGTTFTGLPAHLIKGAAWAAGVAGAIQLFGPILGLEDGTINALSVSAAVGIMTSSLAAGLAEDYAASFGFLGDKPFGLLSYGTWAGIGVAVVIFLLMYSKEKEETIIFECRPWQAPTGGNDCEKCNKQGILPCSEYQCRSLGQACELVNQGTSEESCVWVNRQDVNPPIIEPSQAALLNDYRYSPDNSISPPDRGVKVLFENSQDRCVPAFTPLRFGVELNEPAACKIDSLRKSNFEEMGIFMSSGLLRYNHSFALSLPSPETLESQNITIKNNGNFEMFVRCRDANGNSNTATFSFSYCVDEGPDTTPPLIVTTSILSGVPIAFNQSSIDLEVYVNEPSQCKWSHNNRDYDSMEETLNCGANVFEFNAQALYKCSTTLTGLKDRTENDFFFRCRDQPSAPESERNVNAESYEFTLIGTQPLVIDSVKPNDTTIRDSTDTVKVTIEVETSAGYKQGESICYYSNSGDENNYIQFFETSSFKHLQDLHLPEGSYEYFIRCIDLGGNTDNEVIHFDVDVDFSAPTIVRAYNEENFLKLITNEDAECVYSTFDCNYDFEEGTPMTVISGTDHFTEWNTDSNLYVKCQDDFGNRPLPNQCSINVRPSDF